ncbi:MAG: UbiA family prenyltransferase [Planctomycetales bacterium]|nr:UbiA family prenyltransferase [Planctomycetales bacterium]
MEQRTQDSRSASPVDELNWGRLADWAELVRLPNIFTLISNCIVAALVAIDSLGPGLTFVPVLLASMFFYWAGMILNDVVDIEKDREHRPSRPLPSGRISPVVAGHVATGFLLISPIIVLAITNFRKTPPLWMGAAFGSAVLLSLSIRAYDSILKSTPIAPILMGLCRTLNILMVGFTCLALNAAETLPPPLLAYSAAIGIYIFGVTIFARREDRQSWRAQLVFGLLFVLAGLTVIAILPRWAPENRNWPLPPLGGYLILVTLLGLTVAHRAVAAIAHPVPRKVQLSVRHAILSLIFIDATVGLMWGGTWYGILIVLLLLPTFASALKYRST